MQAVIENSRPENFSSSYAANDNGFAMGQQHRPIFRKRSLADLPGNVRVPVFKKPDRLKSRLEASLAGLRELQTLREKHQVMVNRAMTSFRSPDSQATEQAFVKGDDEPTDEAGSFDPDSTNSLSQLWQATFGDGKLDSKTTDATEKPSAKSTQGIAGDSLTQDTSDSGEDGSTEKQEETAERNAGSTETDGAKDSEGTQVDNGEGIDSQDSLKSDKSSSKNSWRPRSMSMSHFLDPRKHQERRSNGMTKNTRSSADDILSANPRVNRKDSIFEGVDISIQGPNPVHAILMQYGPLSATQSMPSVCPNIPRRPSALLCKPSGVLRPNSESSSSTDSVFSCAETVTSNARPETVSQRNGCRDEEPRQRDTWSKQRDEEDDVRNDLYRRELSVESRKSGTESRPDSRSPHTSRRNVPPENVSTSSAAQAKTAKDRGNLASMKSDNSRSKSDGADYRADTETHESCENIYETIPFYSSSNELTCQSPSSKEEHSGGSEGGFGVSSNGYSRSASLSSQHRPSTRSRPLTEHGSLTNIRERSGSLSRVQQSSRLTQSSNNLSPKGLTLPKGASLLPVGNCRGTPPSGSTSSKRSVPGAANTGKKARRFGVPLDSKLIHNLLARQEKSQPLARDKNSVRSKRPSIVLTEPPPEPPASPNVLIKVHGKENARLSQPLCSMETIGDEYGMARLLEPSETAEITELDDEYGMAVLLDSSKTLTSTPVMRKKEQGPQSAKHSFASDEGYCPSLQDSSPSARRRFHHKASIRSDRTWISSDMEESDVCSGEISPYSVTTSPMTKFSFSGFSSSFHRRSDSFDSNRIISSRTRLSPDWDTCSQRSSSVSVLTLSTDVQESSL